MDPPTSLISSFYHRILAKPAYVYKYGCTAAVLLGEVQLHGNQGVKLEEVQLHGNQGVKLEEVKLHGNQ